MMKKIARIILSSALLAVLALSLVGCRQLDAARKTHAIYLDDSKEQIELNGQTYSLFETKGQWAGESSDSYLMTDDYGIYVTDKDVPVLLKEAYGRQARYNNRGEWDIPVLSLYDDDYNTVYYVRDDLWTELRAQRDSIKLDQLFIKNGRWDTDRNAFVAEKGLLSDKAKEVILKTLERPVDAAYDIVDDEYLSFASTIDIYRTDKDVLYTNGDLIMLGSTYNGDCFVALNPYSNEKTNSWKKIANSDTTYVLDLISYPADEPLEAW